MSSASGAITQVFWKSIRHSGIQVMKKSRLARVLRVFMALMIRSLISKTKCLRIDLIFLANSVSRARLQVFLDIHLRARTGILMRRYLAAEKDLSLKSSTKLAIMCRDL